MARLPVPGSDEGDWGEILNNYLRVSLDSDGTIKDDAVSAAQVQDGSLTGTQLHDSTIPPVKLDAIDSPTNGEVLAYNNARFEWVSQSGGSVPDASSSTKGVVQLTNDLGGTATAPTVPALANKADKVTITGATKTKITYNNQGIVTAGVDATQDDIGDGVTNKQYSSTEKTKLAGIASGATANSSDATLLSRANHTGTQTASTISDFTTAADARVTAAAGTTIQPLDADLTAIAALSPTNDDIIQRKAGAWTNRTPVQVKTDLAITKSDIGLANVDNTSDASKPISSATQTALDTKPTSATIDDIVTLTQAEYTALVSKVATTLYIIIP